MPLYIVPLDAALNLTTEAPSQVIFVESDSHPGAPAKVVPAAAVVKLENYEAQAKGALDDFLAKVITVFQSL